MGCTSCRACVSAARACVSAARACVLVKAHLLQRAERGEHRVLRGGDVGVFVQTEDLCAGAPLEDNIDSNARLGAMGRCRAAAVLARSLKTLFAGRGNTCMVRPRAPPFGGGVLGCRELRVSCIRPRQRAFVLGNGHRDAPGEGTGSSERM